MVRGRYQTINTNPATIVTKDDTNTGAEAVKRAAMQPESIGGKAEARAEILVEIPSTLPCISGLADLLIKLLTPVWERPSKSAKIGVIKNNCQWYLGKKYIIIAIPVPIKLYFKTIRSSKLLNILGISKIWKIAIQTPAKAKKSPMSLCVKLNR